MGRCSEQEEVLWASGLQGHGTKGLRRFRATPPIAFLFAILMVHAPDRSFGQQTFSKGYDLTHVGGIEAIPGTRDFLLCHTIRYDGGNIDGFSFHRLDSAGSIISTKSYSAGSLANVMQGAAIPRVRIDGTFSFLFGNHEWNSYNSSIRLFNTNPNGSVNWNRRIELEAADQGISNLRASGFHETPDGGFLIAGTRQVYSSGAYYVQAPMILKLDELGNVVWNKTFNSEDSCVHAGFSEVDPVGNILLGINSNRHCNSWGSHPYLVKIAADGSLLWGKRIEGVYCRIFDCLQQQDGFLIMGSDSLNFHLMRIDEQGGTVWAKSYVLTNGRVWYGSGAFMTYDGGVVLSGAITDEISSDILIFKVDANGALVWVSLYGSEDSFQTPIQFIEDVDGSLLGLSHLHYDGPISQIAVTMLRRIGEDGYNACATSADELLAEVDLNVQMVDVSLDDFDMPMISQPLYINDSLVQVIGQPLDTCSFLQAIDGHRSLSSVSVRPNPFTDHTLLDVGQEVPEADLVLYSTTGREVRRTSITSRYVTVYKGGLSPGPYFFRVLKHGSAFATGRLIIE